MANPTIFEQQIKSAIVNYDFITASFLAERLFAHFSPNHATDIASESKFQNLIHHKNYLSSLYLLAKSYYADHKPNQAYKLLELKYINVEKNILNISMTKKTESKRFDFLSDDSIANIRFDICYLFALCCYDLEKYSEAESILLNLNIHNKNYEQNIKTNSEHNFVLKNTKNFNKLNKIALCFNLLGRVLVKQNKHDEAGKHFIESLKINPFLWSSFELLCKLGILYDTNQIFNVDLYFDVSENETSQQNIDEEAKQNLKNINKENLEGGCDDVFTTPPLNSTRSSRNIDKNFNNEVYSKYKTKTRQGLNDSILATPSTSITASNSFKTNTPTNTSIHTPETNIIDEKSVSLPMAPKKQQYHQNFIFKSNKIKAPTMVSDSLQPIKEEILENSYIKDSNARTKGLKERSEGEVDTEEISQNFNSPFSVEARQPQRGRRRRSSIKSFKTPNHTRSKSATARDMMNRSTAKTLRSDFIEPRLTRLQSRKQQQLLEQQIENGSNQILDLNCVQKQKPLDKNNFDNEFDESGMKENKKNNSKPQNFLDNSDIFVSPKLNKQIIKQNQQNLDLCVIISKILRNLAQSYQNLRLFKCHQAVKTLISCNSKHMDNGGQVHQQIGQAYFEIGNYIKAFEHFKKMRLIAPQQLEGVDIFSTVLWHLKKQIDLAQLAQEVVEFDKLRSETQIVVGNCFSLQKEHERALRFFQRALQLNNHFSYAYTLSAHEYFANEDYDKAIQGYRHAIRYDPRHYNAWNGLGTIYLNQEDYNLAIYYFKRAISINSECSVLYCFLGITYNHLKNYSEALNNLEIAWKSDPANLLAKYEYAAVLIDINKFQEACKILEEIRNQSSDEASVHFLLGKIYHRLGMRQRSIMSYNAALDHNSKDKYLIKSEIDKIIEEQTQLMEDEDREL